MWSEKNQYWQKLVELARKIQKSILAEISGN